jgi:hypothetical protein
MEQEKPKKHMKNALKKANFAIASSATKDPQELLNAATKAVLVFCVGRELGPVLPEVVVASLEIVMDPTTGIFSMSTEDSLQCMGLAFEMMNALR